MKVLLRKNIQNLGEIGDVVDIKPGYARNYLLPQRLAYQPTGANIQAVEAEKEAYFAELARQREQLEARARVVDGKEVTIAARANPEGHLYGSVGPAQIVAALAEQNLFIEPRNVQLPEPIRQLDKYEVALDFEHELTATVHVWVVPLHEEGAEGIEPAPPVESAEEALPAEPSETVETAERSGESEQA